MRLRISLLIVTSMCCALSTDSAAGAELRDIFGRAELPWLRNQNPKEPELGEAGEAEEEPLETDRDSFTPSTTLVGVRRTIFESSYSFIQNRDRSDTHSFPEIITRFGLTDRLELRLGWNFETGGGGSVSGGASGSELEEFGAEQDSQLLYGVKFRVTEQAGWTPESAGIIQVTTPTSGRETASDFQLGYVFGWTLFDGWKLDSAVRYVTTKEEGDHFNQWTPSVVLKVPLAEQWEVHGEYFGIFTDGRADGRNAQYFSPGIHHLLSPNLEVGVRVGWGLNQDAANFFSNVGLGLRF